MGLQFLLLAAICQHHIFILLARVNILKEHFHNATVVLPNGQTIQFFAASWVLLRTLKGLHSFWRQKKTSFFLQINRCMNIRMQSNALQTFGRDCNRNPPCGCTGSLHTPGFFFYARVQIIVHFFHQFLWKGGTRASSRICGTVFMVGNILTPPCPPVSSVPWSQIPWT